MGKWIALISVVLALSAKATDFPLGTAAYSQNSILTTLTSPNTNSSSAGLFVEKNCFHAIQVNLSTNLVSSALFVVDGSLDNTNWVPLTTTNTIANTGGATLFTYVGPVSYLRLRSTISTNAVGTAIYLGGQ